MSIKNLFTRKCTHCGQSAGLFKKVHPDCERKHNEAKQKIMDMIIACFHENEDFYYLEPIIKDIARENFIDETMLSRISAFVYKKIADAVIDQGHWSDEMDNRLFDLSIATDLDTEYLFAWGTSAKVNKAQIIFKLENGEIPYNAGDLTLEGILFQKGEGLIYSFWGANLYQQVTRTQYRGGHAGFSMKVAKGLYFRTGGFRGEPVHTNEMKLVDMGNVVVTDKNLYFKSIEKSLRIPLTKIISLDPYEDGLGIHTDGASARPMTIQNVDGWFMYNLISLLVRK